MKYIYIGKIVSTHGIKGEIRLISNFRYKNKVFKKDFEIYIGEDKTKETIVTYRVHKHYDMLTLVGYTNINEILKYMKKNVEAKKDDIILDEGLFLDEDLIGLNIIVDGINKGIVKRIEKGKYQDLIIVENKKEKYKIPYVSDIILNIDLNKKEITVKNIKGLIP